MQDLCFIFNFFIRHEIIQMIIKIYLCLKICLCVLYEFRVAFVCWFWNVYLCCLQGVAFQLSCVQVALKVSSCCVDYGVEGNKEDNVY